MITLRRIPSHGHLLLANLLFVNLGYFMVIPLLAVYLTFSLSFSPATTGAVLAVSVGLQKLLTLIGGILADRFDRKSILLTGIALRAVAFLLYAFAGTLPAILLAAIVSAVGGALFGPPIRAALALSVTPENRRSIFAGRQIVNNIGSAVGPLAGAGLALLNPSIAFMTASLIHVALAVVNLRMLESFTSSSTRPPRLPDYLQVVRDKRLLAFCCLTALFMLIFSQMTIAFPLKGAELTPFNGSSVGARAATASTLFLVNSITVIALQLLLLKRMARLPPLTAFRIGSLTCGLGVFLGALAPNLVALYGAVLVFTLGEVAAFPAIDDFISEIAPEKLMATYYGLISVAWSLGASTGNTLGGWLVGHSSQLTTLGWLVFPLVGLIVMLAGPLMVIPTSGTENIKPSAPTPPDPA